MPVMSATTGCQQKGHTCPVARHVREEARDAELESLVDEVGFTPAEALRSATLNAARFMGSPTHSGRSRRAGSPTWFSSTPMSLRIGDAVDFWRVEAF